MQIRYPRGPPNCLWTLPRTGSRIFPRGLCGNGRAAPTPGGRTPRPGEAAMDIFRGQLVDIYLTARKGDALRRYEQAEAVLGRGLVGDRYSPARRPDQEVTFIAREALEALGRE